MKRVGETTLDSLLQNYANEEAQNKGGEQPPKLFKGHPRLHPNSVHDLGLYFIVLEDWVVL